MRYVIIGILAGIILGISPVFMHKNAPEIIPVFAADLTQPESVTVSPFKSLKPANITVPAGTSVLSFTPEGSLATKREFPPETLFSVSRDGSYIASYQKLGEEIEFSGMNGERFWTIKSKEYPYVSRKGRIVLLLVADLSKVRVVNYNGNDLGVSDVSGKMCTSITFAKESESAAVGFLDGSVFVISEKGEIVYRGRTPNGTVVKSIALSDHASRMAVHYGTTDADGIMCVDLGKKEAENFSLPFLMHTRTAVHVKDDGRIAILGRDSFIIAEKSGDIVVKISMPPVKPGHSAISFRNGVYSLACRLNSGGSSLYLFTEDGIPVMVRPFPEESYLDVFTVNGTICARGLSSLYTWKIQ